MCLPSFLSLMYSRWNYHAWVLSPSLPSLSIHRIIMKEGYQRLLPALFEANPGLNRIFVFVHKMDLIEQGKKKKVYSELVQRITEEVFNSDPKLVEMATFYPTTIWTQSLSKVCNSNLLSYPLSLSFYFYFRPGRIYFENALFQHIKTSNDEYTNWCWGAKPNRWSCSKNGISYPSHGATQESGETTTVGNQCEKCWPFSRSYKKGNTQWALLSFCNKNNPKKNGHRRDADQRLYTVCSIHSLHLWHKAAGHSVHFLW